MAQGASCSRIPSLIDHFHPSIGITSRILLGSMVLSCLISQFSKVMEMTKSLQKVLKSSSKAKRTSHRRMKIKMKKKKKQRKNKMKKFQKKKTIKKQHKRRKNQKTTGINLCKLSLLLRMTLSLRAGLVFYWLLPLAISYSTIKSQ